MPNKIGSSNRTLGKHALLNKLLGREAGVMRYGRHKYNAYTILDLCAGNGQPTENSPTSSPEIIRKHYRYLQQDQTMQTTVILVEKDANTFAQLQANYSEFTLLNTDASSLLEIPSYHGGNVFIYVDPNHVHAWPINDVFAEQLPGGATMLITLGCNVGGLKRLPVELRVKWLDRIEALLNRLPRWHDAMIAALREDKGQWAYLIVGPAKWHENGTYRKDVGKAFCDWQHGIDIFTFRSNAGKFLSLCERLFLRTSEKITASGVKSEAQMKLW